VKLHPWAAGAAILALGLSCRAATDLGQNTPAVSVSGASVLLTDAPPLDPSISSVIVYITEIDGSASSDSLSQTWATLVAPHKRYDLLTLQNGTMALLGTADLAPAQMREVRVKMNTDSSGIFQADGTPVAVHWGYTGAITVNTLVQGSLQLSGSESQLVLDFNVANSFARDTIHGGFDFLPWITAETRAMSR